MRRWTDYLAYRDNAFAAPVVKYQQERQHALAETGIYETVRHPMYSVGMLIWLGMSLWLLSYPGALLMRFPVAAILLRILIEGCITCWSGQGTARRPICAHTLAAFSAKSHASLRLDLMNDDIPTLEPFMHGCWVTI